jgi:hypothetical protein
MPPIKGYSRFADIVAKGIKYELFLQFIKMHIHKCFAKCAGMLIPLF